MDAQVAAQTAPDRQTAGMQLVELLLALSAAAGAITRQHYRMPTERERLALGDAVAAIVRVGRLHGLEEAPTMGRAEAERIFRTALRHAGAAGVPREQLVAIFHGEEELADQAGRKDLQ